MSTSADGSVNGRRKDESARQRFLEEHPKKLLDGALEIRETDTLVDQQALDLMEHRRMSDIGVAAIDSPGQTIRIGGCRDSMVRTCTGEVCVRSNMLALK